MWGGRPPGAGVPGAVGPRGSPPPPPREGGGGGPPREETPRSPGAPAGGPTRPAPRANPCPEVTDPSCRLPLPTLFYRPEAVHLGDLLRLLVRPGGGFAEALPRIFKGRPGRSGPGGSRRALPASRPYLRASRFQGAGPLRRKDNSSRGPGRRLRDRRRRRSHDPPVRAPESRPASLSPSRGASAPFLPTGFPCGSGSAHPRPTAVRAEPFPTSALQVPAGVLATATKIRTRGRSARARAPGFSAGPPRPPTPPGRRACPGGGVWAGRSSAIHFRGRHIRQVGCYTILSGFRLPWPPPCCQDVPTPFVVSRERPLRRRNPAFGSSRIASSAYQKWPTGAVRIRRPPSAGATGASHAFGV